MVHIGGKVHLKRFPSEIEVDLKSTKIMGSSTQEAFSNYSRIVQKISCHCFSNFLLQETMLPATFNIGTGNRITVILTNDWICCTLSTNQHVFRLAIGFPSCSFLFIHFLSIVLAVLPYLFDWSVLWTMSICWPCRRYLTRQKFKSVPGWTRINQRQDLLEGKRRKWNEAGEPQSQSHHFLVIFSHFSTFLVVNTLMYLQTWCNISE
jgi:hypothetical protein